MTKECHGGGPHLAWAAPAKRTGISAPIVAGGEVPPLPAPRPNRRRLPPPRHGTHDSPAPGGSTWPDAVRVRRPAVALGHTTGRATGLDAAVRRRGWRLRIRDAGVLATRLAGRWIRLKPELET